MLLHVTVWNMVVYGGISWSLSFFCAETECRRVSGLYCEKILFHCLSEGKCKIAMKNSEMLNWSQNVHLKRADRIPASQRMDQPNVMSLTDLWSVS